MEKKAKVEISKKVEFYVGIAILVVLLVAVGYELRGINFKSISNKNDLSLAEAKTKVTDFINHNLMSPGTKAEVGKVVDDGNLYKVSLKIKDHSITAYMTKDGKTFFPEGMDVALIEAKNKQKQTAENSKPAVKSDKPKVQLFVMSYCPYGTQAEKGILPVLKTLGNKIDFQLEFVDYSMHSILANNDEKELKENLRQYCIQKNQPKKLDAYLTCFLKKGKGTETACLNSAGINVKQISDCMNQTDSQYKVTKNFKNKKTYKGQFPTFKVNEEDNKKYKVQGSPTLVINGTVVSTGRDSASLLKKICSAFNQPPKECKTKLSSVAPSPGFGGSANAGAGSGGSCKN